MKVEQRRISPRMGLPPSPFSKGVAPYGRGYHNAENGLLPSSETTVEETQEVEADGPIREADEEDGPVLRKGVWRDLLEVASHGLQTLCGSFGRPQNGQESHR